jgi:hypothetical protein
MPPLGCVGGELALILGPVGMEASPAVWTYDLLAPGPVGGALPCGVSSCLAGPVGGARTAGPVGISRSRGGGVGSRLRIGERRSAGGATGDLGLLGMGDLGLEGIGERGLDRIGDRGLETIGDLGGAGAGEIGRGTRFANKSSLGKGSIAASLLGWIGGDERLELVTLAAPECSVEMRSARGLGGDGERRLQSTLRGLMFSLCCMGERESRR